MIGKLDSDDVFYGIKDSFKLLFLGFQVRFRPFLFSDVSTRANSSDHFSIFIDERSLVNIQKKKLTLDIPKFIKLYRYAGFHGNLVRITTDLSKGMLFRIIQKTAAFPFRKAGI